MVNFTYGVLEAPDGMTAGSINLAPNGGNDLIVTYGPNNEMITSYSAGDIGFILLCTALILLMIPGLGYLYSGLTRRKNALHLLMITIAAMAVVLFQWFFWGYSLTFSDTGNDFLGNLQNFGFMGVLQEPVAGANNKLPRIVYAVYQSMFASLVPAIALGAACERARIWPFLVFTFCWSTVVYCPIAYWVWNPAGWAFKWGVLDYAGGGPVEINSGIMGTVVSYYLGPRLGYGTEKLLFKPHNVSHVVLGTVLLWFGWLGFNGGSTFAANLKAGMAIATTNLAASAGGLTWMFMDWRIERKWSVVGFCTGAIAGLVAITPAAGFLGMPAALLVGVAAAVVSNLATSLKNVARCDDAMDIFAVHALAGVVGLLLTGIFAQASVAANDAITAIPGGWLDGNFIQLPKQIAWCAVTTAWCGVVTYLLMFILDHIPYIGPFRSTELAEIIGLDEDQCGEHAYDYAMLNRDLEGNCDRELTNARNEPHLDLYKTVASTKLAGSGKDEQRSSGEPASRSISADQQHSISPASAAEVQNEKAAPAL